MSPITTPEPEASPSDDRVGRLGVRLKSLVDDARLNVSERRVENLLFETLLLPGFLRKLKLDEGVSRTSQWLAAFLLVFVVPLTVNIMTAVSLIMEGILSAFGDASEAVFFQFFISGINLAFLAISFWFWVLWVSTGGFRLLEV